MNAVKESFLNWQLQGFELNADIPDSMATTGYLVYRNFPVLYIYIYFQGN